MTLDKRAIHLCDCSGSCNFSNDILERLTVAEGAKMHSDLCISQAKLASDSSPIVACTQEPARLEEVFDRDDLHLINLRDSAGWTNADTPPVAKIDALLAQALLPAPQAKSLNVSSDGMVLVLGEGDVVQSAAHVLSATMSVTWLTTDPQALMMPPKDIEVIAGTLTSLRGSFGQFEITVDAFQERIPSGRGTPSWTPPVNAARARCDVVVDMRGAPPLVSAPHKRDGYFHVDPRSITAVMSALTEASHMFGTFDKTIYIDLNAPLCAHSRAQKSACSRCLDLCPTGAITSAGDHVAIDPMICAGCGACAAACPSEAITYSAHPSSFVVKRLQVLAQTYLSHDIGAPRLLVLDQEHGAALLETYARYGDGLPADVIPFTLEALAQFGHAEILAAFGVGFASVSLIMGPKSDHDAIMAQVALAQAILPHAVMDAHEITDPDALGTALPPQPKELAIKEPLLPMGGRRQITRMIAKAANETDAVLPLPQGAPYGAVLVNEEACTLCLSCVSLCPSGALVENEDRPELRFQEDACLQCGLCANICPEKAITLEPRLNLAASAVAQQTLKQEDPFACIECGALFGVKSTIEKITKKIAAHSMFQSQDQLNLVQMCDNCRVKAQFHAQSSPFALGERPRPRTTDDYKKQKPH